MSSYEKKNVLKLVSTRNIFSVTHLVIRSHWNNRRAREKTKFILKNHNL